MCLECEQLEVRKTQKFNTSLIRAKVEGVCIVHSCRFSQQNRPFERLHLGLNIFAHGVPVAAIRYAVFNVTLE